MIQKRWKGHLFFDVIPKRLSYGHIKKTVMTTVFYSPRNPIDDIEKEFWSCFRRQWSIKLIQKRSKGHLFFYVNSKKTVIWAYKKTVMTTVFYSPRNPIDDIAKNLFSCFRRQWSIKLIEKRSKGHLFFDVNSKKNGHVGI